MGSVAVPIVGVVAIAHPLLQLAPATDLGSEQAVLRCRNARHDRIRDVQHGRSLERSIEQFPDQLLVVRDSALAGAVLRRPTVWRDELAIGGWLEPMEPKAAGFLQVRPSSFSKKLAVSREGSMLEVV